MTGPPPTGRSERTRYVGLLLVQAGGAACIIWKVLPLFLTLSNRPGDQVSRHLGDYGLIVGALIAMQAAYWYSLHRIPGPLFAPNVFLSHIFLFLARLNFIFGAALFSVVFFRHIPALGPGLSLPLFIGQGVLLLCALFALFCLSLDLERLSHAFAPAAPTA